MSTMPSLRNEALIEFLQSASPTPIRSKQHSVTVSVPVSALLSAGLVQDAARLRSLGGQGFDVALESSDTVK